MNRKEKITQIEKKASGPVAASKLAGVAYPTWYRWKKSDKKNVRLDALLDLLLEKLDGQ